MDFVVWTLSQQSTPMLGFNNKIGLTNEYKSNFSGKNKMHHNSFEMHSSGL